MGFDWKCLKDGVSTEQFMDWFLLFTEGVFSEMKARGSVNWCWLSLGGSPPPLELAQKLSAILDSKYPDLLRVAVIAPIPSMFKHMANGMLHFLPRTLKEKFKFASTGREVSDLLDCKLADLPQRIQQIEKEKVSKPAGF